MPLPRFWLDIGLRCVHPSVCPSGHLFVVFRDGRACLTNQGEICSPVLALDADGELIDGPVFN